MGGQTIPPLGHLAIVGAIGHLRATARECRAEADRLTREAAAKRNEAHAYDRRADAAEQELYGRVWSDLVPGDVVTLNVFGREGWERERREVVAVDWPVLTLRDGDREYDFDASGDPDSVRDLRLVPPDEVPT